MAPTCSIVHLDPVQAKQHREHIGKDMEDTVQEIVHLYPSKYKAKRIANIEQSYLDMELLGSVRRPTLPDGLLAVHIQDQVDQAEELMPVLERDGEQ